MTSALVIVLLNAHAAALKTKLWFQNYLQTVDSVHISWSVFAFPIAPDTVLKTIPSSNPEE